MKSTAVIIWFGVLFSCVFFAPHLLAPYISVLLLLSKFSALSVACSMAVPSGATGLNGWRRRNREKIKMRVDGRRGWGQQLVCDFQVFDLLPGFSWDSTIEIEKFLPFLCFYTVSKTFRSPSPSLSLVFSVFFFVRSVTFFYSLYF